MLSLLVRCLVMLLVLALANGNAHTNLDLASAEPEQTVHHAHHAGGKASHQDDRESLCCCDCLGCISAANLTPDLTVGRADLPIALRYDVRSVILVGRALLPEPDPPRPIALT